MSGNRKEASEPLAIVPSYTWRCAGCGKLDGQDTGAYTDGLCGACIKRLYPKHADAVLAAMRRDGDVIH